MAGCTQHLLPRLIGVLVQTWQALFAEKCNGDIEEEASLINVFKYVSDAGLTNIVARHHSAETLSVDEYERINDTVELKEKDSKHRILVIKINRLYQRDLDDKVLYDAVRGVWRTSKEKVRTA